MIPALFFLVVGLAFGYCFLNEGRGSWQAFMAAGFAALVVAFLYVLNGYQDYSMYIGWAALATVSFALILSVRKK